MTPQQIINANQGGYPFSNGQIISIPSPGGYGISQNGAVFGADISTPQTTFTYGGMGSRHTFEDVRYPEPGAPGMNFYATQYSQQYNRATTTTVSGQGNVRNTRDVKPIAVIMNEARDAFAQAAQQYELTGQFDPTTLPRTLSIEMQARLGYGADQFSAMGYVLSGNQWVRGDVAANQTRVNQTGLNPQQGTTPFGMNAAGQRLDIDGNVWDPTTATRDIYGGRFIQVGETRWERNAKGKLVKVRYLGGGKKERVKQKKQRQAQAQAQQNANETTGTYVTNTTVSFGAGSG